MSKLKSMKWLIPYWEFLILIEDDKERIKYMKEQIEKIEQFEKENDKESEAE